jgi:transcriptional regulator with XRE-family HTH domain
MSDELKIRTSKRIKELRLKYKYTMEALSELIGVSKSTIAKWENGYVDNIRQDNIIKLAEVFNVSPTYILGYVESEEEIRLKEFSDLYKQLTSEQKTLVDNMITVFLAKQ